MAVKVVLKYQLMHKGVYPMEVELAVDHYPQYETHPRKCSKAIEFEESLPVGTTVEYLGMYIGKRFIEDNKELIHKKPA